MSNSDGDKMAGKRARSIFNRRGMDVSQCDVRVSNGIFYLRGMVRYLPGTQHYGEFEDEMRQILKGVRNTPGIRDVIAEYTFRG